ncbi:MAG TPA: hypothetical protein VH331_03005 [Allosphingosinicella sp.]|nr:hypothetical protein [Allosphingosinicella sp.]
MKITALALSAITVVATAAHSQSTDAWTVGKEAEVHPGVQAKLLAEQNGWRLWRIENQRGVVCDAVKPTTGQGALVPTSEYTMVGSTPYLRYRAGVGYWLIGQWLGSDAVEWRLSGARFWTKMDDSTNFEQFDGKTIEIHVSSWRYPNIMEGHADEQGTVDLTGIKAIAQAARDCAKGTKLPEY